MNFIRYIGRVGSVWSALWRVNVSTCDSAATMSDLKTEKATFAMGCFWCPEPQFGVVHGVIRTRVGYTGGTKLNPTYRDLGDHTESIELDFDPEQVKYEKLLEMFWKNRDTSEEKKTQYMTAIFYHNEEQRSLAEKTRTEAQHTDSSPITAKILPAGIFYPAESYHQKYRLQQHPEIMTSLGITESDLTESHVCARLNGYIHGDGSLEAFDAEWQKLGLTKEQADYIRKFLVKGTAGAHC